MADINDLLQMRRYFNSGVTKDYAFRKKQLIKLRDVVLQFEQPLYEALYTDLKKNPEESSPTGCSECASRYPLSTSPRQ